MDLSTDHQLMLTVRDGNVQKLGLLFERYHKLLYNFFLKQTGNQQTSEDLVQEVFLRMLKYRHTYRGVGKFTTWMFQIARNAGVDFFRQQSRYEYQNEEIDQLLSNDPDPDQVLEQESDIDILQKALARLSPEKREVLVLSRFQNLRYQEISQILGCKLGTVKARVFRALKDLTKNYFELSGENRP